MPAATYLVIEVPGLQTPWILYSARHPEAVIDVVLREAPQGAGHPPGTMNACLQLRHAPPGTLPGVLEDARRAYGALRTLSMDERQGMWLGTFVGLPPKLPDPRSVAIFGFLAEHGLSMQWVRVEEGVAYWRCEVPGRIDALALETSMRDFLASRGIDADTSLEVANEADLARVFQLGTLAAGPQDLPLDGNGGTPPPGDQQQP